MRSWFSGTTGMVAALLIGAVVASAATAGAASLITGKQIKDGSISKKDLAKALQKQLAKHEVPAGAHRPAGSGSHGGQGRRGGRQRRSGTIPRCPSPRQDAHRYLLHHRSGSRRGRDYLDSPVSFCFRFSAVPSVVTVAPDESGTQAAVDARCGGTAR